MNTPKRFQSLNPSLFRSLILLMLLAGLIFFLTRPSGILGMGTIKTVEESRFCRQYTCQKVQISSLGAGLPRISHDFGVDYEVDWYRIKGEGLAFMRVLRLYPDQEINSPGWHQALANQKIIALEFFGKKEELNEAQVQRWSAAWFQFALGNQPIAWKQCITDIQKIEAAHRQAGMQPYPWLHYQYPHQSYALACWGLDANHPNYQTMFRIYHGSEPG